MIVLSGVSQVEHNLHNMIFDMSSATSILSGSIYASTPYIGLTHCTT